MVVEWVKNRMGYVVGNMMGERDGKVMEVLDGDEKRMYYGVGLCVWMMIGSLIEVVMRLKKVKG